MLDRLNLNNNQFTSFLPLTFSRLTKLRTLLLNNNNLISIDCQSFLGLTNLEIVYLGNNPISSTQQCHLIMLDQSEMYNLFV